MAEQSTKELIERAIGRVTSEAPALEGLKLVMGLELRGRGDVQLYRVEMPGPRVTKDPAADARVRLELPRARFNELAREGRLHDWRRAFESGHARATGPDQILKLIANVIARQEARARSSRGRP